jgi:nitroreductase
MSVLSRLVDAMPTRARSYAFLMRDRVSLIAESAQDYFRYRRFSGPADKAVHARIGGRNLEAQLTKDYHRIEKGLSFRAPKTPFGSSVKDRLDLLLPLAAGSDESRILAVREPVESALSALDDWNSRGVVDHEVSPVGDFRPSMSVEQAEQLFMTRHSLRNFDETRAVPPELVTKALEFVSRTPSVCNRQAGNIHLYSDPEQIRRILKLQGGSAGFSETITSLAAVTVEIGLFTGTGERNQRWVDGGLTAMTLVWALHSLGVHTCMLNWSKRNTHSERAREVGGIPASEDIICLVAFGYPPADGYRVARSPRRRLDDFSTTH